jgi:hypothetical protein
VTVYLSPAARLARALLTPDTPDLPVGPTWWADRRSRIWVEHNGWLHVLNECTGRTTRAKWPPLLVQVAYGPLMDVTPEWGAP